MPLFIFWKFLDSLDKYDRIVFSFGSDCIVTIESEQKKGATRQLERLLYHVSPCSGKGAKFLAEIPAKVFVEGLRSVMFALALKKTPDGHRTIIISIKKDRLRFIAGDRLIAICDFKFDRPLSKMGVRFSISREITDSLLRALPQMKDKNIEVWRGTQSNSCGKVKSVFLKQDKQVLSFAIQNLKKKKTFIEEFSDDYQYKANSKAENWILIFNSIKAKLIEANPLISITADFIDGEFNIEYHSKGSRMKSAIPFVYDSGFSYIDTKSIQNEDVSFQAYCTHLARVFKEFKPQDTVKFEFGHKNSESQDQKDNNIPKWGLIRFPVKTRNAKGITKSLIALFQVKPRKEN